MAAIGLFYGSTSGNTRRIAELMQRELDEVSSSTRSRLRRGLVFDEENQPELTPKRVAKWARRIRLELG